MSTTDTTARERVVKIKYAITTLINGCPAEGHGTYSGGRTYSDYAVRVRRERGGKLGRWELAGWVTGSPGDWRALAAVRGTELAAQDAAWTASRKTRALATADMLAGRTFHDSPHRPLWWCSNSSCPPQWRAWELRQAAGR
jgi:hypothetical protein